MNAPVLSVDHDDALREVANVAMGQAADSLARLLNTFVEVSVPAIRILDADDVQCALRDMVQADIQVTGVRQAFYNALQGEAVMVYGDVDFKELAQMMDYEGELDDAAREELLLDVSNLLLGAFLSSVARQIEAEISFAPPSILGRHVRVDRLMAAQDLPWERALIVEIRFGLEERNFSCYLMILIPEQYLERVGKVIDHFIESI